MTEEMNPNPYDIPDAVYVRRSKAGSVLIQFDLIDGREPQISTNLPEGVTVFLVLFQVGCLE